MTTDKLTLESFGVDLDATARRITDRQQEIGRDDAACAQLAGVSTERWRSWKEGSERPGVARVPRIAAAIDLSVAFLLYGATSAGEDPAVLAPSTVDARKVLDVLNRLAPAVETVEKLAEEIARLKLPIPGGAVMGVALELAGNHLSRHDAVTLTAAPPT